MAKIDNLLQNLCPQGVEFKELGEVGELVGGSGLPKADFTESGVGCIHYGQIYTYYDIHTNRTISFVSKESAKKLKRVRHGDVIIAKTSENIEDVCKSVAYMGSDEIVTGGHTAIFRHKQNPKFISYYLNGAKDFQIQKRKQATGVKVLDVSLKRLAKIKIPIPPLSIQAEIVRILDQLTDLDVQLRNELEQELDARKKQYEHYREESFQIKDVKFKALGEIGTFVRGKRFVKSDMVENGVPCIHYGEIYTHYGVWAKDSISFLDPELAKKLRVAKNGDVIIVAAGETIEDIGKGVAWFGKEDVVIHDACFIFKHNLNPKFVSYYLQTHQFHSQIRRSISSGKISSINSNGLAKAKIPIPSPSEQERIVAILDKFEALVNDISEGLPAEVEARRKQYEYYREQLLTFKEKGAA